MEIWNLVKGFFNPRNGSPRTSPVTTDNSEHWSDRVRRLSAQNNPEMTRLAPTTSPPTVSNLPAGRKPTSEELHRIRIEKIQLSMFNARKLGIRHAFMHMSALSPSTRPGHAARHGKLYSGEEMIEWWSKNDNWVGCKCSAAEIIMDENGLPILPQVIERAINAKKKMKERGEGDWTKYPE